MAITWGPAGTIYANVNIDQLSPEQRATFDAAFGGGSAVPTGTTQAPNVPANVAGVSSGDLSAARAPVASQQVSTYQRAPAPTAAPSPAVTSLQRAAGGSTTNTPAPAPTGGGAASSAPSMSSLLSASRGGGGGGDDSSPQMITAPDGLRQGIGQRIYPQYSAALAALQRAVY